MPPLRLSHLATPALDRRQMAAVAALALAACVVGELRLADLRAQADALRAEQERSSARHAPGPAQRRGAVHGMVAPAVHWERLLQALESSASPDVTLLAFDPSPPQRRLRLEGEARDLPSLLDYLRRLGAAGPFGEVRLESHQAVRDDPQHPVRFTIISTWGDTA